MQVIYIVCLYSAPISWLHRIRSRMAHRAYFKHLATASLGNNNGAELSLPDVPNAVTRIRLAVTSTASMATIHAIRRMSSRMFGKSDRARSNRSSALNFCRVTCFRNTFINPCDRAVIWWWRMGGWKSALWLLSRLIFFLGGLSSSPKLVSTGRLVGSSSKG